MPILYLGIDVGGTFTDLTWIHRGELGIHKVPSTPSAPEQGILRGVREILEKLGLRAGVDCELHVIHGSTVATNAFLERKGVRVAFVGTEGHHHLPFTRRQARARLYDLNPATPPPILEIGDCHPMRERVGASGEVLTPIDDGDLARLARRLRGEGYRSAAVTFLFSHLEGAHEAAAVRALEAEGIEAFASHEVLPRAGEFERASATLLNAYLTPIVGQYLDRLVKELQPAVLHIMKSSGGLMPVEVARRAGIHTILSGPAGGVTGAQRGACGRRRILAFDMGGTSTDVSLLEGRPVTTHGYQIEGWPVGVPVIDILTIGAGGGSIARFDRGGSLRVGPESAGADPGPACYGKGWAPTVTDAHVALGHIPPGRFLGGRMAIDRERSIEAIRRLSNDSLAWEALADGILEVVRSNMARALRSVSVGRGKDPSRFSLVSFGGSGGLHVFPLARALGIREVIVPRAPGVLSALGMLGAAETVETEVTLARKGRAVDARSAGKAAREACVRNEERLASRRKVQHRVEICLRYQGRNEELAVPFDGKDLAASRASFHKQHEQLFGYSQPDEPIEVVSLRVVSRTPPRRLPALALEEGGTSPEAARIRGETPLYDRGMLRAGNVVRGPALVIEDTGTTLVPEYGSLTVAGDGALIGEVR